MSDTPKSLDSIHTLPHITWMDCVAVIPVAVDSFHLSLRRCHVTSQAIRQAEMHPPAPTHDLIWLVVSLTPGQN